MLPIRNTFCPRPPRPPPFFNTFARDESPYPPNEKHYHMVALELRGADKTAVFQYLRTDASMLGEVLNRLVREDCLAADHSAAFLDSKSLGTLHNVKHGRSGNEPTWLETGYGGRLKRLRDYLIGPKVPPRALFLQLLKQPNIYRTQSERSGLIAFAMRKYGLSKLIGWGSAFCMILWAPTILQ